MAIGNVNLSRNDVDVEWRIEDFFSFTNTNNGYFSPDFFLGGQEWNIRIYPNGDWLGCEPTGYIDLIFIRRFSGRAIMQDISLSIKTVTGEKDHEHSEKLEEWGKPGLGQEFLNFVSRSELLSRRSELVPNDVLTVVCSMKQTASAGSASNTASASNQCCHCKITFSADSLPSHRKKCMRRSIKCPDCLEVVVLRTWIDEHECQQERPEGARSLSEDYKKVLFGGCDHNVILKVGDKELRAHRDILRARSRVLESMLDHDMKEKNTGIIDVPDCDPNAMELFLSYVYCGKIEALDHNNMLGLYYVADKYEMMELKRECCNFIKKSLSLINICSVIHLALKHSDSDLLEYATGYFSDNVLDIMQTVEWQSFHKDNFKEGNELLMKAIKKLKSVQA